MIAFMAHIDRKGATRLPRSTHRATPSIALDLTDRAILEILQHDARIANNELADRVHLTPAPCLRRVKRLEQSGVIERYVALLSPNPDLASAGVM